MNIAITGASGLIGRRLARALTASGHGVVALGRSGAPGPGGIPGVKWDPQAGEPPEEALHEIDAVIHLAGESVARRWSPEVKRRILDSRVIGTRNLVCALGRLPRKPALVCASAAGYYGSRGDELLSESAAMGSGFLAEVTAAWEREAQAAEAFGIRVVRLRIGVVLDSSGGALGRMLLPFRLGLGGRLGGGRQWMPWVHAADLVELFRFAAEKPVAGAFNACSPHPVTNGEFTKLLAAALGRPAVFTVPGLALKLAFGDMAEVLLSSQRAIPEAAEREGFRFQFPELGPALEGLLP